MLTQNQIEYVIFHLNQHVEMSHEIRENLIFVASNTDISEFRSKIIFRLESLDFSPEKVRFVDGLFVPFSSSEASEFYHFENENLVFTHDIFTSAFYLLSGMQEFRSIHQDKYGRFPYENSLQSQFGFISKPLVNYYFDLIIEGIKKFCNLHQLSFQQKSTFENWQLLLTHDVDIIDRYTFRDIAFRAKQLFQTSNQNIVLKCKNLGDSIFQNLKFHQKPNPYLTFDYIIDLAEKYNFRSTWFFLNKGEKQDARYRFSDKRLISLFEKLKKRNDEIALHGSFASFGKPEILEKELKNLQHFSKTKPTGIRQHFLKYSLPETALDHQKIGLKYDATLGFAAHEGFRNSYVNPFHLFDFEKDRMIEVLQIPLQVMDVTWLNYRKLNYTEMLESLETLLAEVKRFKGVFCLLWHNNNLDEKEFPGVKTFYEQLLQILAAHHPKAITISKLHKLHELF